MHTVEEIPNCQCPRRKDEHALPLALMLAMMVNGMNRMMMMKKKTKGEEGVLRRDLSHAASTQHSWLRLATQRKNERAPSRAQAAQCLACADGMAAFLELERESRGGGLRGARRESGGEEEETEEERRKGTEDLTIWA